MMLEIYLARHGQDLDNVNGILNGRRDMPLSEKGLVQANEAAEMMVATGLKFDRIFTSPLQRAKRTAEIMAERLGMPEPEVIPDLIERDFGVLTGEPKSKIAELSGGRFLKTETVDYFLDPEGAETFDELVIRGRRVLDKVKASHPSGSVLLVTHGDFGKMIYAAYYNLDWKKVLEQFHFGNSEVLKLSPNSPAEEAHVFKIRQFNN